MLFQKKKEEREFWIEVIQDSLKILIEQQANAIIYKLTLAMNGEDFSKPVFEDENSPIEKENPYFIQSLIDKGLTKEDIMELQKNGIDLRNLSSGDYEVL